MKMPRYSTRQLHVQFAQVGTVNRELNVVRNTLIKTNKLNQNKVEKERVLAGLKLGKYVLLKPEHKLNDQQKVKLDELK